MARRSSHRLKSEVFVDAAARIALIMEVIPVSAGLFAAGWALYSQRLDKEWGLTDCISFSVMIERQITDAFTSDHHFEQAGFRKLL
jgi:predicted nucleic acid-binding protein